MNLLHKYIENTVETYDPRYLFLLITVPDGKACCMRFTGDAVNFNAPVSTIETNINSILNTLVDNIKRPAVKDIKTSIIKTYDVLDDAELTTRNVYHIYHPERLFMSRNFFLRDWDRVLQLNIRSMGNRIYFFMEYAGEEEVLTIKTI